MDPRSQEFAELVVRLQKEFNLSHEDATSRLFKWQSRHGEVEEMMTKQAHKEKV